MGQNILVTINNYDLPNIKCVRSLQGIDWKDVDCLIYHSSTDSEFEVGLEITKIKGVVNKVIYINKNINPLFYCMFTGLDADIYDEEDNLMDATVLDFLIGSYKETGMTIKPPNSDLDLLAKGIETIASSNFDNVHKMVSNPFWVKTLATAVSSMDNALTRTNQLNIDVVEMLDESAKFVEAQKESLAKAEQELMKAMDMVSDLDKRPRPNTPYYYSTYSVPVAVPKVLYIKAYGNCKYLNSFVLSYQHYLKMIKQYSSKLLVVFPKQKLLIQRYKTVPRLAPESIDMLDMRSNDVFITFEPKKAIMDTFFSYSDAQVFIVLDLMLDTDKLIQGHMVETFYALNSLKDIRSFKLPKERCINAIVGTKDTMMIPHINKYSDATESTKKQLYFDKCSESFKKIDSILLKNMR